jgi:hypothetical protein
MSKPRVKLLATVDNAAHATTIRDGVVANLVGKDVFESANVSFQRSNRGGVELVVDVRFNNDSDRDSIRDWILSQVRDTVPTRNWVSAGRLEYHLCSHDNAIVQPCTAITVWEKS